MSNISSPHVKTGHRKWFVLAAGFCISSVVVGFLFNMSILYVEWLVEFKKTKSETALVQSVCTGTFYIGGFISGVCITKYGCRKCGLVGGFTASAGLLVSYFATSILYLVFALGVAGFGFSLSFISALSSVQRNFNGRLQVIALAITDFGSGLCASLSALLFELLIQEFGWRGTLLIESGIMLNIMATATLFGGPIESTNSENSCSSKNVQKMEDTYTVTGDHQLSISTIMDGRDNATHFPKTNTCDSPSTNIDVNAHIKCINPDSVNLENKRLRDCYTQTDGRLISAFKNIMVNKVFVIYVVVIATSVASFNSVLIFILDYLTSNGISKPSAVRIYVYMNIVNTVSRIIPGLLKQLPHISVLLMPALSTFLGCVSTGLFPFVGSSYGLNLLTACTFACGMGSMVAAIAISIVNLIGTTNYPAGLGVSFTAIGICLAVGGPVSGYIRDVTGNYDVSMVAASALFFVSCVSILMMMLYRHHLNHSKSISFDMDSSGKSVKGFFPWKKSVKINRLQKEIVLFTVMDGLKLSDDYNSDFDGDWYFETYYREVSTCDYLKSVLKCLHEIFKSGEIRGRSLLDIGTGPTIHSIISACPYVQDIYLSDLADSNRNILQRWKEAKIQNGKEMCDFILQLETDDSGYGLTTEHRFAELRRKIKAVLPLDLRKRPLSQLAGIENLDIIISSQCFEIVCQSIEEYTDLVSEIAALLPSGGHIVLNGLLDQTFYRVGGYKFRSMKIKKSDVESAFKTNGFEIKVWKQYTFEGGYENSDNHTAFVMYAVKESSILSP